MEKKKEKAMKLKNYIMAIQVIINFYINTFYVVSFLTTRVNAIVGRRVHCFSTLENQFWAPDFFNENLVIHNNR